MSGILHSAMLLLLAAGMLGLWAPQAEAAAQQMQITFGGYNGGKPTLTNFPVLVVLSNNVDGASGFTFDGFVTTTGYDLRFYTNATDTGSGLNYEIESWNTNAGQASYVWVQVPEIPGDGSGYIYAKWGDSGDSSQLACTTNGYTWTNGYVAVWHLGEASNGPYNDSGTNRINSSSGTATKSTGVAGYGQTFNGLSDKVDCQNSASLDNQSLTVTFWIKPQTPSAAVTSLVDYDHSGSPFQGWALQSEDATTAGKYYWSYYNGTDWEPNGQTGAGKGVTITGSQWQQVAYTKSGTSVVGYKNGSSAWTPAAAGNANISYSGTKNIRLANAVSIPTRWAKGDFDELRISSVARSADWVWAEYLTMASNTVFNNYGAMEAVSTGGAPAIQNQPVTSVTTNSATFNGYLSSTGSSATAVWVLWGDEEGTTWGTWATTNLLTAPVGGWTNNSPLTTNITTGIDPNKTYYYTFAATNDTTNAVAGDPVHFITGEVTVDATDPDAQFAVPTSDNGVFTFYRPLGCTNEALTVSYTMTGTATQNTHYTLSGSATFAAGSTNAVLTLEPNPGAGGTAILTLTAGAYPIGTASNDTVTIAAFLGKVWTGATSTDWTDGNNWAGGVPGETDDVLIDGGSPNQPTINLSGGAKTIKSLTIGSTTTSTLTFQNGNVSTKKLIVTGNVTIGTNGKLTHTAETATGTTVGNENHRLFLDVGGNLTIDGTIDVKGRGYSANNGPAPGGGEPYGAGHGGQGGAWTATTIPRDPYGSPTNPVTSGSGGNSGRGGGTVKLTIGGTLNLDGSITADAQGGQYIGEAGGSVNITAGKLTGSGTVSADGSDRTNNDNGKPGGGGRVAIVLTNDADTAFASWLSSSKIHAYGGTHVTVARGGAAGTVYLKGTNTPNGRLIVNNSHVPNGIYVTTLVKSQTLLFDRIEASNYGILKLGAGSTLDLRQNCVLTSDGTSRFIWESGAIQWPASYTLGGASTPVTLSRSGTSELTIPANLTIATNGVLTHEAVTSTGSNPEDHMLYATIQGNLTIDSGGTIDVRLKGYPGSGGLANGPGAGQGNERGASHGGEGGIRNLPYASTYGSVTDPVRSGSGANSPGGGAAKLTIAGALSLNGSILADGQGNWASSAGGSVNITASTLTGSGMVSANGGSTTDENAGGGGRVAIVLTNATVSAFDTWLSSSRIQAYGGTVNTVTKRGAAGTVYLKGTDTTPYGRLIVDNNNISSTTGSRTDISALVGDITVGDVILRNNGRLSYDSISRKVTAYGSWSNGVANADSAAATVTLAGNATATVWGDNNFGSLIITNAGKIVSFQPAVTQTINASGALTLTGADSTPVRLLPATAGQQWYIKAPNTMAPPPSISYVVVSNSTAVNTGGGQNLTALFSTPADVGGVDNTLGVNTNWSFPGGGEHKVWIGASDTSWGTDGNWSPSGVPQAIDASITISNVVNQPVLDIDRSYALPLTIQSGASLSLGGRNLILSGAVTNSGAIIATTNETLTFASNVDFTGGVFTQAQSTVRLAGTGPQTVSLGGNPFYILNIANTNAITVTDAFTTRDLTFTNTSINVTFQDNFTATNVQAFVSGASTLTFGSGKTYAMDTLALVGAAASKMVLTNDAPGAWNLHVASFGGVGNVAVNDSDAFGYATIYAANSENNGGNVNWDFGGGISNKLWVGTGGTAWSEGTSWLPNGEPGSGDVALILGGAANQPTVTFAGTKTIQSLFVAGASTLTFDSGDVTANKLRVNGNAFIGEDAVLTHTAETATGSNPENHRLFLDVGGNLTIDGTIGVSYRGYSPTMGPGGGLGNNRAASHGGEGGTRNTYASTYGSVTNPERSGSGGANGPGGGTAKLVIGGALALNGSILADGWSDWMASAGGSVNITAGTLTGAGTVSANGGNTASVNFELSGGGGRMAIVLTNAADTALYGLVIRASGGTGNDLVNKRAAAGTVYLKGTNTLYGRLIVDNNGSSAGGRTTINAAVGDITVGDVVLRNQGRMAVDLTTRKVTAYGNWSNAVAADAFGTPTVELAGNAAATIWGDNNWYNLTITNAGKTVKFEATKTQTINASGTVLFDNNVTLKSTTDDSQWILTKGSTGSTQDVGVVSVRDSDASDGMTFGATMKSSDLGNNDNWIFPAQPGTMFMLR